MSLIYIPICHRQKTIQNNSGTIQDTTNSNNNFIYLPLKNLLIDISLVKRLMHWFEKLKNYRKWYYRVLGPLFAIKDKLISTKQRWFKGVKTWENPPQESFLSV